MSRKIATRAVRAGIESDRAHGAVIPPLYLAANYTFEGFGKKRRYDYSRTANPTRDLLAEALADLEGGGGAIVTATGMAAVGLVLRLVRPGELVVAPHDCYGGTYRLLDALHRRGELRVAFVDQNDAPALEAAFSAGPKLVWIETPSNPLLRITDIASIAIRAAQVGACTVVDNTFLSPLGQEPFTLGADIVVHSTTKYLNGHSDVVGGAVVTKGGALHDELAWWANATGVAGAPFDSWLTLRGVRTLPARWRLHEQNAAAVVDLLVAHPAVSRVHFPGLASHPGHALAARQQKSFGAMVSFELEHGVAAVERFLPGLNCFSLAESLGGVESLIAHPASMTHAAMDARARARAGIGDGLLRISVGIEDPADLCADLAGALDGLLVAPE